MFVCMCLDFYKVHFWTPQALVREAEPLHLSSCAKWVSLCHVYMRTISTGLGSKGSGMKKDVATVKEDHKRNTKRENRLNEPQFV